MYCISNFECFLFVFRFEFDEGAKDFLTEEEKEQVDIINGVFGAGNVVHVNNVDSGDDDEDTV